MRAEKGSIQKQLVSNMYYYLIKLVGDNGRYISTLKSITYHEDKTSAKTAMEKEIEHINSSLG